MKDVVIYASLAIILLLIITFFLGKIIRTSEWIMSKIFSVAWGFTMFVSPFFMCIFAMAIYDAFLRKTVLYFTDQIEQPILKEENLNNAQYIYSYYKRWFT